MCEREGKGEYDVVNADQFNNMIEEIRLNELLTTRGLFTWNNKSRGEIGKIKA